VASASELDCRILRADEPTVEGRFVTPPLVLVQAALGWPAYLLQLMSDAPLIIKPVAPKLILRCQLEKMCNKVQAVVSDAQLAGQLYKQDNL